MQISDIVVSLRNFEIMLMWNTNYSFLGKSQKNILYIYPRRLQTWKSHFEFWLPLRAKELINIYTTSIAISFDCDYINVWFHRDIIISTFYTWPFLKDGQCIDTIRLQFNAKNKGIINNITWILSHANRCIDSSYCKEVTLI